MNRLNIKSLVNPSYNIWYSALVSSMFLFYLFFSTKKSHEISSDYRFDPLRKYFNIICAADYLESAMTAASHYCYPEKSHVWLFRSPLVLNNASFSDLPQSWWTRFLSIMLSVSAKSHYWVTIQKLLRNRDPSKPIWIIAWTWISHSQLQDLMFLMSLENVIVIVGLE